MTRVQYQNNTKERDKYTGVKPNRGPVVQDHSNLACGPENVLTVAQLANEILNI